MNGFWDTSALVPLFVPTQADAESHRRLREFKPVFWWATPTEVTATVTRLRRSGDLSEDGASAAIKRMRLSSGGWVEITPTDEVRETAARVLSSYPLKAAAALQLAAALVWCRNRPRSRPFICRDARLASAARDTGFNVIEF